MKILVILSSIFLFLNYGSTIHDPVNTSKLISLKKDTIPVEQKTIKYSEKQMIAFLDSIGSLPSSIWMDTVSFLPDSVYKSQKDFEIVLNPVDCEKLKKACLKGEMDPSFAEKILPDYKIDRIFDRYRTEENQLRISFYSFDSNKNSFTDFAITPGYSSDAGSNYVYFFRGNRLISKHNVNPRYGLEMKHFKDSDGKTVIYYKQNFESGSGIWWFNFNFYKCDGNKLIPVLNELEDLNLSPGWAYDRGLFFKATVVKTNPLVLKMQYRQQLFQNFPDEFNIINTSTLVTYKWDEKLKVFQGDYSKSKISKEQVLSYYLTYNEPFFINAYYKTLKRYITGKDKRARNEIFTYLNKVMNNPYRKAN